MAINFKIVEKFAYIVPSEVGSSTLLGDINRIKRGKYSILSKKRTGFKQAIDIYKGCFHFTNVYSYQRLLNMAKFCQDFYEVLQIPECFHAKELVIAYSLMTSLVIITFLVYIKFLLTNISDMRNAYLLYASHNN